MSGEVVCPSCGKGNERGMAESYRVCVHCGGDMSGVLAMPIQETAIPQQQPYGAPPPMQQPYGAPPPMQQPYGAPPPQQPYGAPYPAQPYGAPGYPQAPVGMYPPTFHPEAYARPEETPRLDIGGLFRVLFTPKAAFEDLYNHTSMNHGILLAVGFILITSILTYAFNVAILGSDFEVPDNATTFGNTGVSIVGTVISVVTGLVMFLLAGWLVYVLLKGPGKARRPSFEKTIGLIGYAKFPAFILGIMVAILTPIMMNTVDFDDFTSDDPDQITSGLGAFCGALAGLFVIWIIMLIWGLWVHSHAASVANDVSLGTAFGFTLLAWFIALVIMIAIVIVVAIAGISLALF